MQLNVSDLMIRYGTRKIVDNVSFHVNSGEVVVLLGPNGSGKTTILRGIAGAVNQISGNISWNNRDLLQMKERERAKCLAVVPQVSHMPLGFTVYDTVALGRNPYVDWFGRLSNHDHQTIENVLKKTQLCDYRDKLLTDLSGGEQQRVILARALSQSTPLLMLDEPTSHLDIHYQITLLSLVRQLCRDQGIAVLLVLHDFIMAARFADRVIVLDQGVIRAEGYPHDIFDETLFSEIYRAPMKKINGNHGDPPILIPA